MMETYCGHVRTPADAIKLFEACRLGLLPRVQRRLSEKERQSIKSGSVFVWDEREAGMRRWTDGKSWSASRVSGSFLTYREMEGKRGGGTFAPPPARRVPGKTPDSGRGSDEDLDMDGDGPDGYRYKPDGLMKQSFSITTSSGQHLHLISYYARPHANAPDLPQPTSDPALRHIIPVKGMYPESTIHDSPQGPPVTRAPMPSYPPPQMSGPPRPPPYGYPVGPAYGWPPSPISTPPYQYPPNGYVSHLPPPPGPHQSPGHPHHSPHPHPSQYPPPHHQQHPSQLTAFDRAPPPLQNSSLPPPPPSHAHMNGPPNGMPSYAPNRSPRAAQAAAVAEQQQRAAHIGIDPRITATAAAAIQQSQAQAQAQGQAQAAAAAYAEAERARGLPQVNGQTTPVSATTIPAVRAESPKRASPQASQAQTIPSISALIHATDTPTPMEANRSAINSRVGSTSPTAATAPASNGTEGPKDIPHDRLKFRQEDNRTLRVLDRKFCI